MSGGWYKHYRNLFERPWAKDAKMVSLYEYLHCCAYVQDQPLRDRDIMIRRGSCLTSRAAIMEGTGLSEHDVKSRLRKLLDYGEIIVKTSNVGTIVTVCDYDSNNDSEDLFMLNSSSGLPSGLPSGSPSESPTDKEYKKEEYNNINLRSHCIPSKMERENNDVALEIKKRYNKDFNGILPPCMRLSTSTRIAVEECLRRFGLQSVDVVFAQIKTEQFSLGNNKTGFIANFTFIFTLKNYQQYLERAQLARQKQAHRTQPAIVPSSPEEKPMTDEQREAKRDEERRQTLLGLVKMANNNNPDSEKALWMTQLVTAYKSGELAKYGIDWKPNNN